MSIQIREELLNLLSEVIDSTGDLEVDTNLVILNISLT